MRHRETYPSGKFYDICICVHAESNAIASAARFGIATNGTTIYAQITPYGSSNGHVHCGIVRV